jgi:peptide/nickel transport system permease protein
MAALGGRRWITQRVAVTIPVLVLVVLITFGLAQLIPGDPARALVGPDASEATIAQIRENLDLNQSVLEQLGSYIWNVSHGDLGRSLVDNRPVLDLILERLPATIQLAVLAQLITLLVAVPAGIIAARGKGRISGVISSVILYSGAAIPGFWLGILLILFFAVQLRWLPAGGYVDFFEDPLANMQLMILPVIAASARLVTTTARFVRAAVLDVYNEDFVRVARAKGMSERHLLARHVLPAALIPVITVSGLSLADMLGGIVLIETVFSIPGFGRLIVDSLFSSDFTMVQGCVLVAALFVVVVNVAVDALYSVVDPRISLSATAKA